MMTVQQFEIRQYYCLLSCSSFFLSNGMPFKTFELEKDSFTIAFLLVTGCRKACRISFFLSLYFTAQKNEQLAKPIVGQWLSMIAQNFKRW